MLVCQNVGSSCRAQLCFLGESIIIPFIHLWKTKPTEATKELMLEFFLMQMALHHPQGVIKEENGAFACDWPAWKNLCMNLYQMIMRELNDVCGKNKYSSSKELALHPYFITVAVEVCAQVFQESCAKIEVTQFPSTCEVTTNTFKKRRIDVGFKALIDALESLSCSTEIIPWLQLLSAILTKYPQRISLEEISSVLNTLIEIHLSCYQIEVKTWLLTSCRAAVEAFCFLKCSLSISEQQDAITIDWLRLWELGVKSVALMQQCHESGHKLLATMLQNKLVSPKGEFYNLYSSGTNNKLSRQSLFTLATFIQKFSLPSATTFQTGNLGCKYLDKDWFRKQLLNCLFSTEIDQDVENIISLFASPDLNIATIQLLAAVLSSLCLQDDRCIIDHILMLQAVDSVEGSTTWQWIEELQRELLVCIFDLPFPSDREVPIISATSTSHCGNLVASVWKITIEVMLNIASKFTEYVSKVPNALILMKLASLFFLIMKNLYLHGTLNESDLTASPLANSLKNLLSTAVEIAKKTENEALVGSYANSDAVNIKDFLNFLASLIPHNSPSFMKKNRSIEVIVEWIFMMLPTELHLLLIELVHDDKNKSASVSDTSLIDDKDETDLDTSFRSTSSMSFANEINQESTSNTSHATRIRKNRYLVSRPDQESPTDDLELVDAPIANREMICLMDEKNIPELSKIKFLCIDVICCFCRAAVTIQSEEQIGFSRHAVAKQMLEIAFMRKSTSLKKPEDIQLILKLLNAVLVVQELAPDDVSAVLSILRVLLNKYSKYRKVCVAVVSIFSKIYPHLFSSKSLNNASERNVEHLMHLLNVLWSKEKEKKCSQDVSFALAETLSNLIKHDSTIAWRKPSLEQSEEDNSSEQSRLVASDFSKLLSSRHLKVRIFVASHVKYLFHNSTGVPISSSRQKTVFENTCLAGYSALEIEGNENESFTKDEKNNRTASLLHFLCHAFLHSRPCEKQILFVMCQLIRDKRASAVFVKKAISQIANVLGYHTLQSYIEPHFVYLFHEWLVMKYQVEEFPYQIFECSDFSKFLKSYYTNLVPLLLYRTDMKSVTFVAEQLKMDVKTIVSDCVPQLLARIFSWYAADPDSEKANQCHCLLDNIITKDAIQASCREQLDDIVICLLNMVEEPLRDSLPENIQIQSSSPHGISPLEFMETVEYLKSRTTCKDSFITLLCQKQDSLQNILLSLNVQLSKSHRPHEQRQVLVMYHVIIDLLLPEFKKGLDNRYLFVLNEVVHTIVSFLIEKCVANNDSNLVFCIELIYNLFEETVLLYKENIGDLLPFVVSRLIPFVAYSEPGKKVLSLLSFLIIQCSPHLEEYIVCLNPFPDLPLFQDVREKQKHLMYKNGPYTLQMEMDHFLQSYQKTGKGTLEGLKHLRMQLISNKEEFLLILENLQEKDLFSEDIKNSTVHQLICTLIHLCTPGNSPTEVQNEAGRCLGEIGPINLSAIVLQPTSQRTGWIKDDTIGLSNVLHQGYCLVLQLLNDYLKDGRIQIKVIASQVLKDIFGTKTAQQFLSTYRQVREDKLLKCLYPFYSGRKVKEKVQNSNSADLEKIDHGDLWAPEEGGHSEWVTKLVCALLEARVTNNEFFEQLIPICEKEPNFCSQTLPYFIHASLLQEDEQLREILSHRISSFFSNLSKLLDTKPGSRTSTPLPPSGLPSASFYSCRASVQTMLSVIHHLWLHHEPSTKKSSGCNDSWTGLDLDYLHVAQAAKYCSAYFTAILYTELWCNNFRQKGKTVHKEENDYNFDSSQSSSQGNSPLCCITSKDRERGNLVYKILLDAYNSIGDPDGIYGCLEIASDSQSVILHHYQIEGKWDRLLNCYDKENFSSGILQSLKNCGLDHILQSYVHSQFLHFEEPSVETIEYQSECAWKLSQWDVPLPESDNPGFQEYLYKSLLCLYTQNEIGLTKSMDFCRLKEFESLSHTSLESVRSILPVLSHLQSLVLLEDYSALASKSQDIIPIIDKWENQKKLPYGDFEFVEPVLWLECILLKQQLDIHPNRALIIKELIKSLEQHAIKSRVENYVQAASRSIHLLKNSFLGSEDDSLRWQVEEAKILWQKNDQRVANHILKSLLATMGKRIEENSGNHDLVMTYAKSLSLKGKWLEETCSENSTIIMQDYLEKAIHVLNSKKQEGQDVSITWDAYLAIARYADNQYLSIVNYKKSTTYQTKQELMESSREAARKMKNNKDITDDQRRTLCILVRQHSIDEEEMKSLEIDQQRFLMKAISNYLLCLRGTDLHDLWVFRLTALWFQNLANKDVNELIENQITDLETYKFLPLMYQLAARMGTQGQFSNILLNLIKQIAINHPHHALPIILSMSNADKDPSESEKTTRRKSSTQKFEDSTGKERTAAAKKIIAQLRKTKLDNLLKGMSSLCDAYISLAYMSADHLVKAKLKNAKIPSSEPIMKISNLVDVPVITEETKVDRSCEYKNIVGIHSFLPDFRLCGGVTVPKVIKCVGMDGIEREQLVKGRDDLRQDAVMQQVFSLVNFLLKQNIETKRRKLHIRTYKVIPMSRRSGVLQWCEGTQVLSQYLVGPVPSGGAHKKYYPQMWSHMQCQQTMKSIANHSALTKKREIFDTICKNYPPVFRYFFFENFPEPSAWFERQQSYTKSVATSAVVGYILGLGDRHVNNILIDKHTAEVVHIDFGIAFEKGRILTTPETVPFRLTRDIVDGMGINGIEGVFKRCCEKTLEVMRSSQDVLLTILEVLLYDPLYDWTVPANKSSSLSSDQIKYDGQSSIDNGEVNKLAERALMRLQQKLQGLEEGMALSINGQVNLLIQQARDPNNLCRLYAGWQPYL